VQRYAGGHGNRGRCAPFVAVGCETIGDRRCGVARNARYGQGHDVVVMRHAGAPLTLALGVCVLAAYWRLPAMI